MLMSAAFNISLVVIVQVIKQCTSSKGKFSQRQPQKHTAQLKNVYIQMSFILNLIFYESG